MRPHNPAEQRAAPRCYASAGAVAAAAAVVVALVAFLMTLVEFRLCHDTSAVTMAVAGTLKEGFTVAAAALVFGERLTALNAVGLVLVFIGGGLYNAVRLRKRRMCWWAGSSASAKTWRRVREH